MTALSSWPLSLLTKTALEHDAPPFTTALVIPGIPIPATASAIHHIVDADIQNRWLLSTIRVSVVTAVITLRMARRLLSTRPFQLLSVVIMPVSWLLTTRRSTRLFSLQRVKWICTMRVAKHLWPDAPGYGNQVLRYWLELPVDSDCVPHRALGDAQVTAQLLLKELALVDGSVERLLELTETPVLLKTVPFGKHKGEAVEGRAARLPGMGGKNRPGMTLT